jgi:hypothetical protein
VFRALLEHLVVRQCGRYEMLIPSAHTPGEAMSLDDLIDLRFLLEADALFLELLGAESPPAGGTTSHRVRRAGE